MGRNCQQICKTSHTHKLNRSENIPRSFRGGGLFFKHPEDLESSPPFGKCQIILLDDGGACVCELLPQSRYVTGN